MPAFGLWQRYPILSSGKRKIRIEFEDAEGSRYNLSLDGDISKNKILKVYELMESLNAPNSSSFVENSAENTMGVGQANVRSRGSLMSVGSKIWYVVESKFPTSTFTSSDVQEMYEEEYKESVRLDAIATYLSRYVNKSKLVRNRKGGKEWVYKIVPPTKTVPLAENNSNNSAKAEQYLNFTKQTNVHPSSINSIPQTANNFSTLTEVN
jgi:predicted transcriptional regulator